MTGIAGLWGEAQGTAGDLLDAMGPRARGHRSHQRPLPDLRLACGHHETRPGGQVFSDGSYVVVLDGRLETATGARLSEPGQKVIDAYREEGVAGFARLRGEFALVLWDPNQSRLICARDALGSRPLVYRSGPGEFAFASEERGLAPLFGQEPLSDLRVAEYLAGVAPPSNRGLRASVHRVVPGTAVVASKLGAETHVFDTLSLPLETVDEPESQARRFHDLLQDAVRRRCDGEARIDCFLSGGLDSSSLVALASAQTKAQVRTLSLIDVARPERSEQNFIEAAVEGLDVDARAFDVGDYDPFAGASAALARHAGPFAAPNLLMMRPLYQAARPGAVLLDGHGGDEVVSKGVGRLLDLARSGAWIQVFWELRGVADLYGDNPWSMLLALYRRYGPGRHKLNALTRNFGRRFGQDARPADDPLDLLSPSFRERSGIDEALSARWKPKGATGRETEHAVLMEPQQSYALEVLDREAQDAGVEGRCPFWDRALIDYSMSLPTHTKLKGSWTRLILRQAMADTLPPTVLWRRDKHDFSRQLRDGLVRSPVLSLEALEAARRRLEVHLDVDRVLALRARLAQADAPVSGAALQSLWRIGLWSIWSATQDQAPTACSLNRDGPHVSH